MNPEDLIESKFRLNPLQKEGLKKLGLKTLLDLLLYLPMRYGDKAELKHIDEVKNGELAVVCGKVLSTKIFKSFRGGVPMAEMSIEDDSGRIKAIWFHQPYMAKKVPEGKFAKLTGQITIKKGGRVMINPELEETESAEIAHHGSLFAENALHQTPIYSETRGLSSLWFQYAINKLLKNKLHESVIDIIPEDILNKYHLPTLQTALVWIHTPQKDSDAIAARKRFSFEEVFLIQLSKLKERKEYENNPSFKISANKEEIKDFTERFNFKMTSAQKRAIEQITDNFRENRPMTRLLEGDVGSGKTAVAVTATYSIIKTSPYGKDFGNRPDRNNPFIPAGLQVAYMAPTEILANQHFESFIKYFKHTGINIGLITGSGCKKFPSKSDPENWTKISKSQLLKWVANGEIPILIGTHALIQKTVKFKHLGLVIIDEQHRFGVDQRLKLAKKTSDFTEGKKMPVPHLLSMTATPIPRTLALTIYGDLDLTLLDEMPVGRKPIITDIVIPAQREGVYLKIRNELKAGRQAYVICPRIDEPDPNKELALNAKSVSSEAKRLKKDIFPEYNIGILHSKMTPKEKEKIMDDFSSGKTNILVATSVVEVGVNVPNATIIVIEGGERFGLSQLHQLRGRVIRSDHQAYCYIFSEAKTEKTRSRLKAIKTAKNGFELAEMDLNLRGFGELCGGKQWGISDIAMEAIKNIKMVEAARNEAREILSDSEKIKNYPDLYKKIKNKNLETHFE